MSAGKADRLARLARAQRAKAAAAAAERARLDGALADATSEADAIIRALNDDTALHGLMVSTMANELQRNARHAEALRRQLDAASARHRLDDLTAQRIEEHARTADREERTEAERRTLEALALELSARKRTPR